MNLVYLASPYSDRDAAVRKYRANEAARAAVWLIENGYTPFSPIVHSHPLGLLMSPHVATDFESWAEFDLAMIDFTKHVVVLRLAGWERSRGVRAEIAHAKKQGFRVDTLDLVGYNDFSLGPFATETDDGPQPADR